MADRWLKNCLSIFHYIFFLSSSKLINWLLSIQRPIFQLYSRQQFIWILYTNLFWGLWSLIYKWILFRYWFQICIFTLYSIIVWSWKYEKPCTKDNQVNITFFLTNFSEIIDIDKNLQYKIIWICIF